MENFVEETSFLAIKNAVKSKNEQQGCSQYNQNYDPFHRKFFTLCKKKMEFSLLLRNNSLVALCHQECFKFIFTCFNIFTVSYYLLQKYLSRGAFQSFERGCIDFLEQGDFDGLFLETKEVLPEVYEMFWK